MNEAEYLMKNYGDREEGVIGRGGYHPPRSP